MRKIAWIMLAAVVGVGLCGCVAVPKTKITGTIAGAPFEVVSPKDSDLAGLEISADTNGTVRIRVEKLSARMNPEVITTTAAGQVALINAAADAVTKAVAAGMAAAAGKP